MRRAGLALATAFLLSVCLAGAADYGSAFSLSPEVSQDGFTLTVMANPWFSTLVGETGDLFLSGVFKMETTLSSATLLLDLGRFEVTLRPSVGTSVEIGRLVFADESGFVASGLLDGARMRLPLGPARFSAGLYYSGLRNKKLAEIAMTAADGADALDPDKILAPSRMLAVAGAELREPPFGLKRLSAQFAAQFDLRGGGDSLHSQYLSLNAAGPLADAFNFSVSLVAALAEPSGSDAAFSAAAAGEVAWNPPEGLHDRVYLGLRAASGAQGGFPYISSLPQGEVFTPSPAGLISARAGYAARISPVLAADSQIVAFLRGAEGGPSDADLDPASDARWLGAELYGSLTWAPFSDLYVLAGAGLFLPASGGAFLPDTPARWLLSVAAVLSL